MKTSIRRMLHHLMVFAPLYICVQSCSFSGSKVNCSNMGLRYFSQIPKQQYVTELDLSNNEISKIDAKDLKNFESLISLDLSFNPIESIQDGSFSLLKRLKTLKLSHCHLKLTSENIFSENDSLENLHLDSNNLDFVPNLPISLRVLILRANKISKLKPSDLPLLDHFDISHNRLRDLSLETRNSLVNVTRVIINYNPWKCSQKFHDLMCWNYRKSVVIEDNFICSSATGRKRTYKIFEQHVICENHMDTTEAIGNLSEDSTFINSISNGLKDYDESKRKTPTTELYGQQWNKGKNGESWNVSPTTTSVPEENDINDSKLSQNHKNNDQSEQHHIEDTSDKTEMPGKDHNHNKSSDNSQIILSTSVILFIQFVLFICTILFLSYVAKNLLFGEEIRLFRCRNDPVQYDNANLEEHDQH